LTPTDSKINIFKRGLSKGDEKNSFFSGRVSPIRENLTPGNEYGTVENNEITSESRNVGIHSRETKKSRFSQEIEFNKKKFNSGSEENGKKENEKIELSEKNQKKDDYTSKEKTIKIKSISDQIMNTSNKSNKELIDTKVLSKFQKLKDKRKDRDSLNQKMIPQNTKKLVPISKKNSQQKTQVEKLKLESNPIISGWL